MQLDIVASCTTPSPAPGCRIPAAPSEVAGRCLPEPSDHRRGPHSDHRTRRCWPRRGAGMSRTVPDRSLQVRHKRSLWACSPPLSTAQLGTWIISGRGDGHVAGHYLICPEVDALTDQLVNDVVPSPNNEF